MADDVAGASPAERDKRRGVAGLVLAFKVAGACASAGNASAGHLAIEALKLRTGMFITFPTGARARP